MPNPAYPTLAIEKNLKPISRDGREEDPTGDGLQRVRKLHADRTDFEIKHPSLNSTDRATLLAFYAANSTAQAIDFTNPLDSAVYVVRFGKGALRWEYASPTRQHAYVRLVAAG